jgi:hypothetical protein
MGTNRLIVSAARLIALLGGHLAFSRAAEQRVTIGSDLPVSRFATIKAKNIHVRWDPSWPAAPPAASDFLSAAASGVWTSALDSLSDVDEQTLLVRPLLLCGKECRSCHK